MVKLFKRTYNFLSRKQTSILSAASVIMVALFLSRILGLLKYWLLATRFTPQELGVYLAAFRIPEMIFELLVLGSVASAFIPVFTTYLDDKNKREAYEVASSVINIGLLIFALISVPLFIFSRQISFLLAPGFSETEINMMASFTRIMVLAQVAPLIVGNFFTGMLQSFRHFLLPALAPVVYNVGIIIGIIVFSPFFGLYGPVFGVVLGALMFLAIQVPLVKSLGYTHTFVFNFRHPGTIEIGKLTLPRTLGLAVAQIDTTIDLVLSTLKGTAAVTVFNFAQHIQQVPIGLFGASIAQAALPTLSLLRAKKDIEEFKKTFISSFHQILYFVIPLSAILIVLRVPIVRLVFGIRSLFDFESTIATSKTLAYFSISLFAQSLIHLLARSFYALHDSKTPFIVGAISVVLNTLLSILFIFYLQLGVWMLGLSASIASISHMLLLLFFLDKKVGAFNRYVLILPTVKILLSGVITAVALYIPIKLLDQLVFDTKITINLFILTCISTLTGLSMYFFLTWFLDVPQVDTVIRLLKKMKRLRRGVMIDTASEVINVPGSNV